MTWIQQKHKEVYFAIISRAQDSRRSKATGIYEAHHIIPKSFGGSDRHENLVLLTPREHYIVHLLLTKLADPKQRSKMCYAFFRMKSGAKSSRGYYNFVVIVSKQTRGAMNPFYGKRHTPERRAEMCGPGHPMFGKTHSDMSKDKMSASKKGRFSGEQNPMFGQKHTDEWCQAHSEKLRGERHFNYGKLAFNAGRKWMNNGECSKMIAADDVERLTIDGWVKGRLPK